jgi:hypothetical protein
MVWNSATAWPLLLLGLLAALGGGCSSSSSSKGEDPEAVEARTGPVLEEMVARIYNGKDMQCIVRAKKGQFNLNDKEGKLRKPTMSFYNQGKWTGNVTADNGIMFLSDRPELTVEKNDIVLRGHIAYNDKDSTLTVPAIRYFSRTGKLVSGGGPFERRMKTENSLVIFTGKYFETDKDLKSFVGHGPAHLKIVADKPNSARESKQ